MKDHIEYLKDLKIQYFYLKKFYYQRAFCTIKPAILKCMEELEKEMDYETHLIEEFKWRNRNQNMSIFDYDTNGVISC